MWYLQSAFFAFCCHIPQADSGIAPPQQIFCRERSSQLSWCNCVQNLLPNWAEEDLLVLLRPFAAMRETKWRIFEFVLGELRLPGLDRRLYQKLNSADDHFAMP